MNNNNGGMADLASAQAQLQSLAQFRAQAGAGHSKMASFSFPNMLPNLMAASSMNGPPGQSLWQQQQAFQMQLQQTSQGPQRKSLFAPYLPQASLPPLLSAGKLVVGVLRVNKRNRSDAYVATDVLEADIYICGSKDRNRALEGDIVAVELLDVDEVWGTKKEKEEKKRKKEENSVYDYRASQSFARKTEKKKDDVEVEGQGLMLFDDEEVTDDTKPTYAGHVVAVVERMPGQLFSGQLGVLRPSSAATKEKQEAERRERDGDREDSQRRQPEQRPKIVWFKPTDKRVPLIAIPTEQAPDDFVDNADKYADRLFVACIKRWPITSLHPFGTLVEELGPIGDTEVETSALLKDCNFPTEDFGEPVTKCLPPLPWAIPEREYELRDDLRDKCVFTIDPAGAKDLDDAVSVEKNEDGTFDVGVHIADVSYFGAL
jgi:protein SSD1